MQLTGFVPCCKVVRNILALFCSFQRKMNLSNIVFHQFLFSLVHYFSTSIIHIIEDENMFESHSQHIQDVRADFSGLAIETDGTEPMRYKGKHILFPSSNEDHIPTEGKLIQSKTVWTWLLSSELESKFLLRAVNLDESIAFIAEYGGLRGRGVAIRAFFTHTLIRVQ